MIDGYHPFIESDDALRYWYAKRAKLVVDEADIRVRQSLDRIKESRVLLVRVDSLLRSPRIPSSA